MMTTVRNARLEEFDDLMAFLNRSFGMALGAFERSYPHLYRPTQALCDSAFVVERQGRIVSHVGLYPIETIVRGSEVPIGGIGAVATERAERGEGHMTRLLYRVIEEMRERGYCLSWLGGDRQRYNAFGWERAGMTYELVFSLRSLDRSGVPAAEIVGRRPDEMAPVVERYQHMVAFYTHRPDLPLQLSKPDLWLWASEDGYVLVRGPAYGPLSILELVSASGQEAVLVRAVLEWTGRDKITWELCAGDDERLVRLLPCAAHWRAGGWPMYRIVDLSRFLSAVKPTLSRRARGLRDFQLAIGIQEHDRTDVATIILRDGEVEIVPGQQAQQYVAWSPVRAARLILGGPPIAPLEELPPQLTALLPVPVFVPALDHV
jgi:predicted N-acetyltransferase YhbS